MNIGDVITTAGALNSLPQGALLLDRDGDAWGRGLADDEWGCTAVEENWNNDPLTFLPLTVLYLPGRLPRPERVVKAEALREAAEAATVAALLGTNPQAWLGARADSVEAGETR